MPKLAQCLKRHKVSFNKGEGQGLRFDRIAFHHLGSFHAQEQMVGKVRTTGLCDIYFTTVSLASVESTSIIVVVFSAEGGLRPFSGSVSTLSPSAPFITTFSSLESPNRACKLWPSSIRSKRLSLLFEAIRNVLHNLLARAFANSCFSSSVVATSRSKSSSLIGPRKSSTLGIEYLHQVSRMQVSTG